MNKSWIVMLAAALIAIVACVFLLMDVLGSHDAEDSIETVQEAPEFGRNNKSLTGDRDTTLVAPPGSKTSQTTRRTGGRQTQQTNPNNSGAYATERKRGVVPTDDPDREPRIVSGTVLGPDKRPVEGATIHVGRGGGKPGATALATTDKRGTFRVDLSETLDKFHRLRLMARKVGYGSVAGPQFDFEQTWEGSDATRNFVLYLAQPCTIRGVVVDTDGKPIADQRVGLGGRIRYVAGSLSDTSDAQGRFEFTDLPSAPINLHAYRKQGEARLNVFDLKPGETRDGLILKFSVVGVTSGIVLGPGDKPLAGIQVLLKSEFHPSDNTITNTGQDGKFVIHQVHKSRASFEASSRGGWSAVIAKGVDVPAQDLVFRCNPPRPVRIRGEVIGEDGVAISQCKIGWASKSGKRPVFIEHEVQDGGFDFEVAATSLPGSLRVAQPRDSAGAPLNLLGATVSVKERGRFITIRLKKGAAFCGRVVDEDGDGMAGLSVRVGGRYVKTNEDGHWHAVGLRGSIQTVRILAPKGYITPARFNVAEGQEDLVTRLERGMSIRGRVVGPEGVVIDRGTVYARWGDAKRKTRLQKSFKIASDATFEVSDVPAHETVDITVHASEPGGQGQRLLSKFVEGVRAGEDDLVVRVALGVEVSGVVINPSGKPQPSGHVSFRNERTRQSAVAELRPDGSFKLKNAAPGEGTLKILKTGYADSVQRIRAPAKKLRVELEERAGK